MHLNPKLNTTSQYNKLMIKDNLLLMIWASLDNKQLTTREASDKLSGIFGYKCPDDLTKTLIKYRSIGLIKGKISMEYGGWIWWADDECHSRGVRNDS